MMMAMLDKMNTMEEHIKKLEADKIEKINATVVDDNDKWKDDDNAPASWGVLLNNQYCLDSQ